MLVNLGFTADAAATHRHEFSKHQGERATTPTLTRVSNSLLSLGFMSSSRRTVVSSPSSESAEEPTPETGVASPVSSQLSSSRDSFEEQRTLDDVQLGSLRKASCDTPISPSRRCPRSKTSFRFAHPPPSTHKRLRIKPRLLLQVQHVSKSSRPISALDVIPSSSFGIRSSRKVSNPCRGNERIGPNDLVVIHSDAYGPLAEEDEKEKTSIDVQKDLVAVLRQPKKDESVVNGVVDVCVGQEGIWEVTSHSRNAYEFAHTDENGLRKSVRWVLRGKENRDSIGSISGSEQRSKRFTFSVIDPTSRRHPIIAWMTKNGIDVLDRYSPTSVSIHSRSASVVSPAFSAPGDAPASTLPDYNTVEIDDQLRNIIVVTGIWVALREGWSTHSPPSEVKQTMNRSVSTSTPSTQQRLRVSQFDGNCSGSSSPVQGALQRGLRPLSYQAHGARLEPQNGQSSYAPESWEQVTGNGSGEAAPEKVDTGKASKRRHHRRQRRCLLCIGRKSPPPSDTSSHRASMPGRGQTSTFRNAPLSTGRQNGGVDAEWPPNGAPGGSQRASESVRRRRWRGLASLIKSVGMRRRKSGSLEQI
ncbi:hypothetical protein LOZ58_005884 [Ophidiomyces ophidiicola]|nr:hypothetical protein LOZ58_005884 [Ophidiomyces ophidiicola]